MAVLSVRSSFFLIKGAVYLLCLTVLAAGTVYVPLTTLYLVFAAAFCILIYARPSVGLALTVMMVFVMSITFTFNSPLLQEFGRIQADLLTIALVYFVLLPRLIDHIRYCDSSEKRIHILTGFLLFWAVLALFWSHDVFHGLNVLTKFVVCVFIFQMFPLAIKDKATLRKLLNVMPWIGLGLACMLVLSGYENDLYSMEILQDIELNFTLLQDHGRPGGFAPPDLAGAVMNIFIFINIALLYSASAWKRTVLVILSFVFAYCMLLTASKGALGSLLLAFLLLMVTMPFFRPYLLHLSIVFLFSVCLLIAAGGRAMIGRINLVMDKGVPGFGLGERLDWWTTGFQGWFDSLGLGFGTGGYLKYIDPVPGTHSVYFSLLFDLGIIGSLIFIFIIVYMLAYTREVLVGLKDNELVFMIYCFVANLAAFWIQALVQGDFQQLIAWLTLALMLSVLKVASRAKRESSDQ